MDLPIALRYWQGLLRWTLPDFLGVARMLVGWSPLSGWSQFALPNPLLLLVLALAIALDALQHRAGNEEFLAAWPRWAQILLVLTLLTAALLAFFADSAAPFVYQGF